jgi:hypothetical protein
MYRSGDSRSCRPCDKNFQIRYIELYARTCDSHEDESIQVEVKYQGEGRYVMGGQGVLVGF